MSEGGPELHWDLRQNVGEWDPKCKSAGPCRVSSCGVRPVQSPLTFDLSLRLGTWDSDLADPCPQLAGECGGTWVASRQPGGPVGRGPIFTLDLAPCNDPGFPPSPSSPRVRVVPSVSRKLILASRDKESLLEEIIDLKRAVFDQQQHIRHHKIQASVIEGENRILVLSSKLSNQLSEVVCKLATTSQSRHMMLDSYHTAKRKHLLYKCRKMLKDIEDMEKPNCQSRSAKPQGTVKLRARIQELKNRIESLQARSEIQSEEIHRLRTDARITYTREIEFERDVFAGEIARLTLLVTRLKQVRNHAASLEDRDQIGPMTEQAKILEAESKKLEEEKQKLEKELEKAEHVLKVNRTRANEHIMESKNFEKKCRDIEHKNIRMAAAIEKTKKSNKLLSKKLRKTEKAFKKAKRKNRWF